MMLDVCSDAAQAKLTPAQPLAASSAGQRGKPLCAHTSWFTRKMSAPHRAGRGRDYRAWATAGSISSKLRMAVAFSSRSSRLRPASASSVAEHTPSDSLRMRLCTLPRKFSTCGRFVRVQSQASGFTQGAHALRQLVGATLHAGPEVLHLRAVSSLMPTACRCRSAWCHGRHPTCGRIQGLQLQSTEIEPTGSRWSPAAHTDDGCATSAPCLSRLGPPAAVLRAASLNKRKGAGGAAGRRTFRCGNLCRICACRRSEALPMTAPSGSSPSEFATGLMNTSRTSSRGRLHGRMEPGARYVGTSCRFLQICSILQRHRRDAVATPHRARRQVCQHVLQGCSADFGGDTVTSQHHP
jgi:hypothetical protein